MMTFRQFILEAPQYADVDFDDPDTGRLTGSEDHHTWGTPDFLGRSETGHSYFRVKGKDKYQSTLGYFATDADGTILMRVRGNHPSHTLSVYKLQGLEGSELKAHDFYYHLLKAGHVKRIMSDNYLSEGGFHVWKKLAGKKDVAVHKVSNFAGNIRYGIMKPVDIEMDDQNDPNTRFMAHLKSENAK